MKVLKGHGQEEYNKEIEQQSQQNWHENGKGRWKGGGLSSHSNVKCYKCNSDKCYSYDKVEHYGKEC